MKNTVLCCGNTMLYCGIFVMMISVTPVMNKPKSYLAVDNKNQPHLVKTKTADDGKVSAEGGHDNGLDDGHDEGKDSEESIENLMGFNKKRKGDDYAMGADDDDNEEEVIIEETVIG